MQGANKKTGKLPKKAKLVTDEAATAAAAAEANTDDKNIFQ